VFDTGKRKCRVTGRLAHTWSAGPTQQKIGSVQKAIDMRTNAIEDNLKYDPNKPIYTGI
jgi:hypothetical protein